MKTLTTEQLNELEFTFTVERTNEEFEIHQQPIGILDNGMMEFEDYYNSWAAGYCTASGGNGLEITFSWIASGGVKTEEEACNFEIEIECDSEFKTNFLLVDQDGDEADLDFEMMEKFKGGEWLQLVASELPETFPRA